MQNEKLYFKVLNEDMASLYSHKKWKKPPLWMPRIKTLTMCESGYHLTDIDHLIEWLGPVIWIAEPDGKIVTDTNKIVCERARLVKRLDTWNKKLRVYSRLIARNMCFPFLKNNTLTRQTTKSRNPSRTRFCKRENFEGQTGCCVGC